MAVRRRTSGPNRFGLFRLGKKALTRGAPLIAAVVLVASCSSGSATDSTEASSSTTGASSEVFPVTIVSELTGPGSTGVFLSTANGAQAAFAEVNASGGIDGKLVDVTVLDSMSTVDGALAATEKALSGDPIGMIYGTISTSTGAAAPRLEEANIPVVFAGPFDDALYPPKPYAFSTFPTNRQQVAGLLGGADMMLGGLEGRKLAVVVGRTAAFEAQSDQISELAGDMGYEVVDTELIELTSTDFTAQAAKITGLAPDVVLISLNPAMATLVSQSLATAGYANEIVATQSTAQDTTFAEIANENYLAYRDVRVPDADGELAAVAKETGFEEGIESAFWTGGYVDATVLIDGLTACGTDCTSDQLIEQLEQLQGISVPSTFGDFSFSPEKHHGATTVQFYRWNTGSGTLEEVGDPVDISGA